MNPADGRRKIWNLEEDSGLLKKLGLHVDPSRESSLNLYDLPKRAIEMVKDAYDGTMVEVVVRRQRELLSK